MTAQTEKPTLADLGRNRDTLEAALADASKECRELEAAPGDVKSPIVEKVFAELRRRLESLEPAEDVYDDIAEALKDDNAQAEFDELIRYMTGKDPATGKSVTEGEPAQCLALCYSGAGALNVIRKRLKELRKVYGTNVLQNRAHASDPEEDPQKELEVLGMPAAPQGESRPCDVERLVNEYYGAE